MRRISTATASLLCDDQIPQQAEGHPMDVYTSPYIRDSILVTKEIEDICKNYAGDGPVFLLARTVTLGRDLLITARPLVIVADLFDGAGFTISARGADGPPRGADGANGTALPMSQMYSADGHPLAGGSDGQSGGAGGSGSPGGNITIYCRRTVNARIDVSGGNATGGGNGGNGTGGASGAVIGEHTEQRDLTPNDPYDSEFEEIVIPEERIDGTPGGNGGSGGAGGSGGNGGSIVFTSISDDTEPVFTTAGGVAGGGGVAGAAGLDGAYSPSAASPGNDGAAGQWGAEGTVTRSTVSPEDFMAGLRPLLDSTESSWANYWAPFRIAMGEFYYHQYDPSALDAGDAGQLAANELERGLELQPDNAHGLNLQAQLVGVPTGENVWVGGGMNVLGLPPQLDILPSFDTYISAFQGFATLATGFLLQGVDTIFTGDTNQKFATMVDAQRQAAEGARDNFADDVRLAVSEKDIAADEAELIQQQLDNATTDLNEAMAKMKDTSFSIGDILGTVAQVASAVVGVIAAIPTAGASLVALVPAMVSLANTVTAQAEPLAKALLSGTTADTKAVEDAYKKVGKQADAVIAAGKTIVNFVSLVQKLSASATPDNSEQVALVRRGAELAHQLLIARNRITLAQQRVDAAQARSDRAADQATQARELSKRLHVDAESIRQAGLLAITIAQSSAEALSSMAFRAARSVEIYTLQPQAQNIALDAGVLSAETWLAYSEHDISDIELANALTASWGKMIKPLSIQQDYLSYFERAHDQDVLSRLFGAGDHAFEQLKTTGRFDFTVDAAEIPAGRADAKVRSVRIALVGAAHPTGAVSCEIRHGGAYSQRRADGEIDVQLLQPRTSTRRAVLTPLPAEESSTVDLPLTAPLSLAFWGRGIGGDWGVSVVGAGENAGLDLSGLTQIQVEIRYQFLR